MNYVEESRPVTLTELARLRAAGQRLTMLTAYDASFAALLDRNGVDLVLVGDSLGNVIQGQRSTLPVSMEQMVYHTECVVRGCQRAMVVSDLPFASYQESREQALRNAARLMAAGAQMVKLEGGAYMADTVAFLVERGIPVCGHIGLTPQSVHQLGGYRVQGRDADGAEKMREDARQLEAAGAALLVLEMVPQTLAAEITTLLTQTATIGIGAGLECDGQVLVLYDLIGVFPGRKPRFSKNFLADSGSLDAAVQAYVQAVRERSFPAAEHTY